MATKTHLTAAVGTAVAALALGAPFAGASSQVSEVAAGTPVFSASADTSGQTDGSVLLAKFGNSALGEWYP